ncbi:MAG: hypothetical protein MUD01_25790 [Chloroflexaceae bacterium]|jgi:hypothetical protein|nr:hypothetical protein [Chloroflexaceae bacterium]
MAVLQVHYGRSWCLPQHRRVFHWGEHQLRPYSIDVFIVHRSLCIVHRSSFFVAASRFLVTVGCAVRALACPEALKGRTAGQARFSVLGFILNAQFFILNSP